jgi:hypothetical protein
VVATDCSEPLERDRDPPDRRPPDGFTAVTIPLLAPPPTPPPPTPNSLSLAELPDFIMSAPASLHTGSEPLLEPPDTKIKHISLNARKSLDHKNTRNAIKIKPNIYKKCTCSMQKKKSYT